MNGFKLLAHVDLSVVIDDLDVFGPFIGPQKAQTPLIVDPNAVLPGAITAKRFQPVPRRDSHEFQRCRSVQLHELAPRDGFDIRKALDSKPGMQGRRIYAFERQYRHANIVYR